MNIWISSFSWKTIRSGNSFPTDIRQEPCNRHFLPSLHSPHAAPVIPNTEAHLQEPFIVSPALPYSW